jgi:hypothetical protein
VTPRPPASPAGPPSGFPLFLVAFLLSPLTLVAWVATAIILRATGWPRWRLAAVAIAGGAFVVLVEGGPTAALSAHFRGVSGLLSQFGAPGIHLSFLAPQAPLAVPVGMLAATITPRPGVALERPDHTAKVRAARREAADRRKARTIAARPATSRTPASVLGVSLGGDLQGWQSGRYVVLPDYAARLPRLVLGRPGQGKSVYLCREAFLAGVAHRQAIVLDGKGDREFAAAVVDAYEAGWRLTEPGSFPTVHLFPDEPLSVWTGTPAEQVNMLLGTWAWSLESQWYKEVCVLALRLACAQPGQGVAGMRELVTRLDPAALGRAWSGHSIETGLIRGGLKDDLPGVHVRMANLAAAAGGLLDGTRAIGEADLTVISLPTMANRGDSESIFRILMADIARWATRKGQRPALVMVDEFSAINGAREQAIDLLERGRSALVPVILAGQSYRSLGDEDTRDRLVSSADALVLFGSATPDELVRLAGTVLETEAVYTVEEGIWTGRASVTHRHRAKVDANTVRQLGVGEAVIVSRGRAARLLVIPAPKGLTELCATAPARAVAPRESGPPSPPQGQAPTGSAPPSLDPAPSSPIRRHRSAPVGEVPSPGHDRDNQEATP